MASYGIAIVVIIAAIAAVYTISTSNKSVFSQNCAGSSGFACGPFALNSSGVLNITLEQATGSEVTVYGVACSSDISSTTSNTLPEYKNVYVTNSIDYYPLGGSPGTGATIYTGESHTFLVYCYTASQLATKANESSGEFLGYVWANFSVSGKPGSITQLIATIQADYT